MALGILNTELSPGPRCVSLSACPKPNLSSASLHSSDGQGTAAFCDVDFSMHLLGVWKSLFCRVVWKQNTFFWQDLPIQPLSRDIQSHLAPNLQEDRFLLSTLLYQTLAALRAEASHGCETYKCWTKL